MGRRKSERKSSSRGMTLFEVLTTSLLVLTLLGFAAFNFKKSEDTAGYAATEILGFLKKARAKALVSTKAYIVRPSSSTGIVARYGSSCTDASPVLDPAFNLSLPSQASLTSTAWQVCYTQRGTSDSSLNIFVTARGQTKRVQVSLGGAMRIL